MTKQLLIYKSAVPVSREAHGGVFIEGSATYGFSDDVNSVPLMAVEFANAASEFVIVFAGAGEDIMPAAILGVRDHENLFLAKDSAWGGRYVPAFLRRYPFVFSQSGDRFLLCIDEQFPGFNREGRGQALFTDAGEPSPYTENVLKFMQEFQAQSVRTQAFCKKVKDLDLLEPMQAMITQGSGAKLALGGFMAVSRAKLKALPATTLAELVQSDELELLYLHQQSMRNFDALKDRLELVSAAANGPAAA